MRKNERKEKELALEEAKSHLEEQYSIQIVDFKKSYGKKQVIQGLNLNVKKGEVFGFIGKNGAGKSTTIDCIIGLKDFEDGHIFLLGKDTKEDELDVKMSYGYVPSEPTIYGVMTGREYLEFVGSSYGMYQESFDANYNYLRDKFEMTEEDMNRKVGTYSHGMQQKVGLMASLIHNPEIWILDEPTVGLDIMVYDVLLKMIQEFAKNGRTVFITSHNIDLVTKVCDRVAILNQGKIATLIDFAEEPMKRRTLSNIFFNTYHEGGAK